MGGLPCCPCGLKNVVARKATDERQRRKLKKKTQDSCEVLSERQMERGGCILPNNVDIHPNSQYDMGSRPVGTGAFGTVRKAAHRKTGKVHAVKTIKKAAISNMELFLNEVEINTSMDHPNIVRLFETFEDKLQVYLVLELCTGGELFDTICEMGCFGERETAVVIKQVMSAVYYMHVQGIAHRDLKPENFLLQDKGKSLGDNVLKVIDFGIATRFKHKASEKGSDCPSMKTMVGTAYYVAPEVLTGKYSEKCDVWSIGVILYILLSGCPPFAGNSDEEIMANVKKGVITFDPSDFGRVSREVQDLIRSLCTYNVVQRPSAGQALNSRWIRDVPVTQNSSPVTGAVINKLKAFSSVNRFKREALKVIAHRLDDHTIVKLRDMFKKFDTNGDGQLTLAEIKEACSSAGLANSADVLKLFEHLDLDKSGSIGYTEFLAGMIDQKNYLREELCWEAFRTFDRDGSGQIDVTELHSMLREDNEAFSASGLKNTEITEILTKYDKDGDGKISFEEFMAMLRSS